MLQVTATLVLCAALPVTAASGADGQLSEKHCGTSGATVEGCTNSRAVSSLVLETEASSVCVAY